MVDHPNPAAPSTDAYDQGAGGMPARTRRAFQSHADQQLDGKIQQAIAEIERVYAHDPDSVVACSGGKDSLTTLVLAAESDATHRALHWDWGARLVPRDLERGIVDTILGYVPPGQLYVASRAVSTFRPYPEHDAFRAGLDRHDGIMETDGSLDRLAGALTRSDAVTRQLVGMRAGESGSRERKLDASGLYGESLGQPAAFPIRDWSARDVWAFLVDRDVPYPSYYDRVAHATGDGSPRDYEQARLATIHDPEFEDYSADGLASWRDHDITQPD